ncbi:tyrosine-protein phosphatase [Actinomycetota bacterium Odt1-20B]
MHVQRRGRTGWGTAVLLTLLGVPRTTVEADFLSYVHHRGSASTT